MVTITAMKKCLIAGGAVISLVGSGAFAGVAAADTETCHSDVPELGAHMPAYPIHRVPGGQDAGCSYLDDSSDTSMGDIGTIGTWSMVDIDEIGTWGAPDIATAGSFPGHSPARTAKPQSVT
jgi:hypothetical protein